MYLYILKCEDNSYYTSVTNNLERRLEEHNFNPIPGSYTSDKLPVKLVYSQYFQNPTEAIQREKQVKK